MLALVFALIVLAEGVALQLLRWGDRRQSLRAAFFMNLISGAVLLLFTALVPVWGLPSLAAAFVLSVPLETLVLKRLEPRLRWLNLLAALVANLASYGLLLLPAFMMAN